MSKSSHSDHSGLVPSLGDIRAKTAELLNLPFQGVRALTGKIKNEAKKGGVRFANVFAAPLDFNAIDDGHYKPPEFSKTKEEQAFLLKALRGNFVFADLSTEELMPIVTAMEKVSVSSKEVIIQQGEAGDYFYVLLKGTCDIKVDGKVVGGTLKKGASFGELALMYSCPRAATVTALEPVELFRVDQKTFRLVNQVQVHHGELAFRERLEKVDFLASLSDIDKQKLVDHMRVKVFAKGDQIMTKGAQATTFYIVEKGEIIFSDGSVGDAKLADVKILPGEYFGQEALLHNLPLFGNAVALTDGIAFVADKESILAAVGDLTSASARAVGKNALAIVPVISKTKLRNNMLEALVKRIKTVRYKQGDYIMKTGRPTEAALYFLEAGAVHLENSTRNTTLTDVGFFGEELITLDSHTKRNHPKDPTTLDAPYTVQVKSAEVVLGVLKLSDCRHVFNTIYLGIGLPTDKHDSIRGMMVTIDDFEKHTILGAGTFGQVWLVSRKTSDKKLRVYALKIQSKYELVKNNQANGVVHEKEIMADLHHPFVTNLVAAFKDDKFIYMLMDLVQGGELEGIMHNEKRDELPEPEAIFYAAGITEGLLYMHRHGYVYRDLKPQNVLISNEGYPIIADFGFAKHVTVKTFTFCGTPLYLAPEIILNRGHNWGADHWSLGILIHEMLLGDTPFYERHMDQMELFKAIVQQKLELPKSLSKESRSIISGLLVKKPNHRLGSLVHGLDDIYWHEWFKSIDFNKLRHKEIKAPFVPVIGNPLDTSNFEDWSGSQDKMATKYPALKPSEEAVFDKF